MATHSSILSGKSHGQRSLVGSNPEGPKELDMTEPLKRTQVFLKWLIWTKGENSARGMSQSYRPALLYYGLCVCVLFCVLFFTPIFES